MRFRFPVLVMVLLCLLLVGPSLVLWGCGAGPAATTSEPVPVSGTTASTAVPAAQSFEEAWAASLAALEALGPTRVRIVETTEGRATGGEISPEESNFAPQTEKAEQLLDVAGARARLTVQTSDRIETTVVRGKEWTSVISRPSSNFGFATVSRYISLEAPEGLPLPLWAGSTVGPTQGYGDLLQNNQGGVANVPSAGKVGQQVDGGTKLSWERTANGVSSTSIVLLDADHRPVRIEIAAKGAPEEGALQGIAIEYSTTIEYEYEQVASFSEADFVLDVPADGYREGVTYELALHRPWSEQADWGQYWLGEAVGEWKLTTAQYAIHEDGAALGSGAEPRDEGVFLFYDRPNATSPNESIQMIVRPLRGRDYEDSLAFAEQRVTSGDWVRQEMTLAGQPATVYSSPLEGGADTSIDSIHVFLPDAFVDVQVWAPVDPLLVLDALSPVE